jgi:hypothetical protein
MAVWIGIVVSLLLIVAGGSWQTWRLTGGRKPVRRSLRARRAAILRRRRPATDETADRREADNGR